MKAHILGFSRIGAQRQTKRAQEALWNGDIGTEAFLQQNRELRAHNWQRQHDAGLDFVSVNDFSCYDQMLDMSALLGVIPERFGAREDKISLNTYFKMARGRGIEGDSQDIPACEMTKWLDTNYHYIVPELHQNQTFKISSDKIFDEVQEAQALGFAAKPVLIGPVSYLYLAKTKGADFDKLDLLPQLVLVYKAIIAKLAALGVTWLQIDEPALVLDLCPNWQHAFETAYNQLQTTQLNILLASYFGSLGNNTKLAVSLPVAGIHVDLCRASEQVPAILDVLPAYKIFSAGVVDGRNIWRNDLNKTLDYLDIAREKLGERLWVSASCSLLHCPVDLENETQMDSELKSWLAFGVQKLTEIVTIKRALVEGKAAVAAELSQNQAAILSRQQSTRIHVPAVKARVAQFKKTDAKRHSEYATRAQKQRQNLTLPLYPTTTIGSFPQTNDIRAARRQFKTGELSLADYRQAMQAQIQLAVEKQHQYGLDVLVHGEAERNDMVEYFGEQLAGIGFSQNGWVQSYGSRCVKPPIIYGDVHREQPMTVEWSTYAQSLTDKPMKGMLTGPVTILQWSFVRDDQPRQVTCQQIAYALRDEVADLQQAGIKIIQIDEPAFREGLPLRHADWQHYLNWAVECFCINASSALDDTQIHTHMCYSEFNDIIESIAAMDADVITIETSRSDMELLDAFADFSYPNEIGPGVYDIHSPRVPKVAEMVDLIQKASQLIPAERLWVNPDCGLKTRGWAETDAALLAMVQAAQQLRQAALAKAV